MQKKRIRHLAFHATREEAELIKRAAKKMRASKSWLMRAGALEKAEKILGIAEREVNE